MTEAAKIIGNTIYFRGESTITTASVREELIHRYQGIVYGSAFGTFQNYEFEAKVLQDLLFYEKYGYSMSQTTGYFNNDNDVIDYQEWLDFVHITGFIDASMFNDFVTNWSYPGVQNGNVDLSFNPEVLNEFIIPTGIMY